jgi:hypothetical protein
VTIAAANNRAELELAAWRKSREGTRVGVDWRRVTQQTANAAIQAANAQKSSERCTGITTGSRRTDVGRLADGAQGKAVAADADGSDPVADTGSKAGLSVQDVVALCCERN